MDRLHDRVGGHRRVVDVPLIGRLAAAAGFAPSGRADGPEVGTTPRQAADLVEARSISWMWDVDDGRWAREAPDAVARLRALPDQERPRPAPGSAYLAYTHP